MKHALLPLLLTGTLILAACSAAAPASAGVERAEAFVLVRGIE